MEVGSIAKFIPFTDEQKQRANSVDLEEFLLRRGERLLPSGRDKRLDSDHSVTIRGCELAMAGFLRTPLLLFASGQ